MAACQQTGGLFLCYQGTIFISQIIHNLVYFKIDQVYYLVYFNIYFILTLYF